MWALRLMGSLVQQGKWGLQPLLSSCLWCCDWRIHLILLSLTVIRQFLGASGLHGYLINSHGVWDGPYLSLTVGAHLSCVWLFVTPWTVTCQVPLSMGFPRQEHWSGLPCPPLGYLLNPGMEPMSPASRALEADSLPLCHLGSPPVDSCWKLSLSLSCFCIDIFFFLRKGIKESFSLLLLKITFQCCWSSKWSWRIQPMAFSEQRDNMSPAKGEEGIHRAWTPSQGCPCWPCMATSPVDSELCA